MGIDSSAFSAFVKTASAVSSMDADTPTDYLAARLAVKSASTSPLVSGLEVGGLGVLAAPSIHTLRDPHADEKAKRHAKYEAAGLGILAAHPAYELGTAAKAELGPILSKLRGVAR
jgi:hypothetical protein